MNKYVHKFDSNIDVVSEAVRVYESLDRIIPKRDGLVHNYNNQSRVKVPDMEEIKSTAEKQDGKISFMQAMLAVIPTDDYTGSIGTYERYWPVGTERKFTVRVSYDTRKKGKIEVETTELTDEYLEGKLAA